MMWVKILSSMLMAVCINAACNECQENMVACHSETTFSICLEDGTYTNDIIPCPSGSYCTAAPYICYSESENPVISCTTATSPDPTTVCVTDTSIKNFRDESDPSCKSYFYCNRRSNKVTAIPKSCDPEYFDPPACTPVKPEGCI